MGIIYDTHKRVFQLNTPESTYLIGVVDDNIIGHLYYGKKIMDIDVHYLTRISSCKGESLRFQDGFPMEYSTAGIGDYREDCLKVKTKDGHSSCKLAYVTHNIFEGKKKLESLPSTFGNEEECTTLEIICEDRLLGLQVTLIYTTFEKIDAITRSVKITNNYNDDIFLTKVLSSCIDMDNEEYDMISLDGQWAKERMISRRRLMNGKHLVSSNRGISSHQANPFIAILDNNADQDHGNVYGMNFVYSGNFMAQAEIIQFNMLRVVMGINSDEFCWKLKINESFVEPEVVMVFSSSGIGGMTRTYHDLYRNHLIRGIYKNKKRPILINNWEATYFKFDSQKIISIASEAAKQGIEMLVLDDGWFGHRNDDACALGDWYVNEEKLQGGLSELVEQINQLGMKFGLWFEPEMISPNSDLYREHPDWAIQIEGREPALGRNQLVLDITRKEVRDVIYEQIHKVLSSANIEYVKWDMNRYLSDLGSKGLGADSQGELSHRYVLALYELQKRLTEDFPQILLENCASGGGRYDPGMLYYSPQIWCSDNTDAIERLRIQEGTAMVYPLSTMGAHISDVPCHSNGRVTPFDTRGLVAMMGTFGYELDITKISENEKNMIPQQIAMYHQFNELIREGDYYRVASCQENHEYDCCMVVSKDMQRALVFYVQTEARPRLRSVKVHLKGLNENFIYHSDEIQVTLSGSTLMNAGLVIENLWGDYRGKMVYLKQV